MLLSDIQKAVFLRAETANDFITIIPDQKGDGHNQHIGDIKPFCKLSIVPLKNREPVYCNSVMRSGFIAANVYAPDGYGAHDATLLAEKIIELFPEDAKFDGVTIPNAADFKGPLPSEHKGWFYVSALIYFEAR